MLIKTPFVTALLNAMIACRTENADYIESLPQDSKDYLDWLTRFNLNAKRDGGDELKEKAAQFGQRVLSELFAQYQSDIIFDLNGHNLNWQSQTWTAYSEARPDSSCSIDNVVGSLSPVIGKLVIDLPALIPEDFDWATYFTFSDLQAFREAEGVLLINLGDSRDCQECGRRMQIALNTESLSINACEIGKKEMVERCPLPKGIKEYGANISVPSGKLVIANRLTALLDNEVNRTQADNYIEQRAGKYMTIGSANIALLYHTEFYETLNMLYLQGANAYPDIYRNKVTNEIIIKSEYGYDLETEEEISTVSENDEKLGSLCMDLWATTAMCLDSVKELCKDIDDDLEDILYNLDAVVVDVEPGNYRGVSHMHTALHIEEGVFVKINRVS